MSGVQDIVEGVTPPRCEYMNGFAACPDVKDTFCARVHDIFPPQVSQVFLGLLKTFFSKFSLDFPKLSLLRVTLEFQVVWSTLSLD